MTRNEKMAQRLTEWRTALEVLEQKLTELTFQIERQRGAIAAGEALLAMADDEVTAAGKAKPGGVSAGLGGVVLDS